MMEDNLEQEDKKLNPYNFNNVLITIDDIQNIFNKFDIDDEPKDVNLYQNAFVHKSYSLTKNNLEEIVDKPEGALDLMKTDNERLEFLGDSVLGLVISKYLYERYPNQNEGFLTRMKTNLVRAEALSYLANEIQLNKFIIMSRHIEDKCNGRNSMKILEDIFEAFIGAIFLDFNETIFENTDFYSGMGFHICEKLIINIIEEKVDFSELIKTNTNYKDQISKYFKKTFDAYPTYNEVDMEEINNQKIFTVNIKDHEGKILAEGNGTSKKRAEQSASRNALIKLGIIEDN